jgi:hypothetical protein
VFDRGEFRGQVLACGGVQAVDNLLDYPSADAGSLWRWVEWVGGVAGVGGVAVGFGVRAGFVGQEQLGGWLPVPGHLVDPQADGPRVGGVTRVRGVVHLRGVSCS